MMDSHQEQTNESSIEINGKIEKMIPNAIITRNAVKRYGKTTVLENLNMTVPRSCIYALLGASGCGKTTLLACIVGLKKLDQGNIWVLGGNPGDKNSGIPGPKVGYMPQDISLAEEFSTSDTMYYFGRINGLKDEIIDEKYNFYEDLLCLPPKNRLVKEMSGGQKRRVSLAVSLLHEAELLILDEPTVGLDPILRESIWNYLVKIVEEKGTAVVITTHYIDEAKLAKKIGLIRNGKLLAETSPMELISNFQCSTIEEAFLILSKKQDENNKIEMIEVDNNFDDELLNQRSDIQDNAEYGASKKASTKVILKALMIKNLLQFIRHPWTLGYAIVFPIIAIVTFFSAIGGDPKDLVIAVVNNDAGDCSLGNNGTIIYDPVSGTCNYVNISCRFLNNLNETITKKQYFDTLEEATNAVKNGRAHGLIYFSSNYSTKLQIRYDDPLSLSEQETIDSEIQIVLDMSSMIGSFLQYQFFRKFLKTQAEMVDECKLPKKFADIPVHFEEPIYGTMDQEFVIFMTPGYIMVITALLATTVSSSVIISDRSEGVWDRSLVQGVTKSAILFSHIIVQFFIVLIQVTIFLFIPFWCYNIKCDGNFALIIALVLMSGVWGLCYGFLISILCKDITISNCIVIGSLFTMIMFCGIIWPIEGLPTFLRWISYFMPITIPNQTFRDIMEKGYSIVDPQVYNGFLILTGWSIVLFACCLGLSRKTS